MRLRHLLAAFAAVVVAALGFSWWSGEQKRQQEADVRAVSVLPAGVQIQWEAYVKRRLVKAIVRDKSQLRLGVDYDRDGKMVVSNNMPYKVSCDVLGASVDFGSGDDGPSVEVFGAMASDEDEAEPALGVDRFSVAAERLNASLCETGLSEHQVGPACSAIQASSNAPCVFFVRQKPISLRTASKPLFPPI